MAQNLIPSRNLSSKEPVVAESIPTLLQGKPVLLLDKTCLGPNFVDCLVNQSPTLVTSKLGHQTLPLELWRMILDFATSEPTKHQYSLVRPHYLEHDACGETTLVCTEVIQQAAFGDIRSATDIGAYLQFLVRPHLDTWNGVPNPFASPQQSEEGRPVKISAASLESRVKLLFTRLTILDIIARVEGGRCNVFYHVPDRLEQLGYEYNS
ncbi:hypothetical protein FALBO_15341 [Fusarium albosuccineum]|uniref:Uncharacterized protein n=1 Tax=Fusarium albosuccineum TaxID=1237068 RepID=A0A8H4KV60_9HYPO|nr:hypothetical protein FALBO_15341 [Fusarium albosuccineum]